MKLKNFAIGIISVGTALTLAACGGEETNEEETPATDPATEQQEAPAEDPASGTEEEPADPASGTEEPADPEADPEAGDPEAEEQ